MVRINPPFYEELIFGWRSTIGPTILPNIRQHSMPPIAAVVATHNRPVLLANRSLRSIALQTRPPDILVVVDDSDPKARHANKEIVADLRIEGTRIFYLENQRTPGAAGAWNTVLSELQGIAPTAYIAILDDDDSWDPDYLRSCEQKSSELNLDMVVAGIIRHESPRDAGRPQSIPERLDTNDLLVRNPHIQGSNLYVRLGKLLEAGTFDESLRSTTDRDICIRLADLGSVRFGAVRRHLVHHYAENERLRLSTRGGDAKRAGLSRFFLKYQGRMSSEQKDAFLRRSRELFDCDPDAPIQMTPPNRQSPRTTVDNERLDLVVGAITSPAPGRISNLMESLMRGIACRDDVTLKVVLLENGTDDPISRRELRDAIDRFSKHGMDIDLKTLEQQASDVRAGAFAATPEQMAGRKSIALSRTMLQRYLFLEAKPRLGSVVWVLDDDVVLDGLFADTDGTMVIQDIDYVSEIKALKKTGASVAIGEVTGDPPLPFLSCMRTQMVDLYHNLHQLAGLQATELYPNRPDENQLIRMNGRDYYYDLSQIETDHLESPFWYEPNTRNTRVENVFDEMVSRLPDILGGRQVFRPIALTRVNDPSSSMTPSINRGPSTLVFDLQALREFPNSVPEIDGADIRRSDMVWSLLNKFVGGRQMVRVPLPIRQDRGDSPSDRPDFGILGQDIRGYALYSAMHDVLLHKAQERQRQGKEPYGRSLIHFDDGDIERTTTLYIKYIRERTQAFELSFLRVVGISSALKPFYEPNSAAGAPTPWWLGSSEHQATVNKLRAFVESVKSIYNWENLENFKKSVSRVDVSPIKAFLRSLPDTVARHRSNTPLPMKELQKAAAEYVQAEFGAGPLRCLGMGEEGVALTDGMNVYKYFHYWKARDRERRIASLESLVGRLSGYISLPDVQEMRVHGDHVVAVYPYEDGTRYDGGHLDGLLTLLRECREAGIACRNIHPDNLLVTQSGVKLIDFGSDIVPLDDYEFEQMLRRALLTHCFHFRSDLKQLMSRALTNSELPELTHLSHLRRALDPRGFDELFHIPLAQTALAERPRSILDYGCGDGRLTETLCREGIHVTGYDPDQESISKRLRHTSPARYGGVGLLDELRANSVVFDSVICSRVLCTISDPNEFKGVLSDLRRLVADTGTVFVAVCNPFHTTTEATELAEKQLPDGSDYSLTFTYTKTVQTTGNLRTDVHRSFASYRRAFSNAKLLIEQVLELDGSDTVNLRPASDHLIFKLRPMPNQSPRVSLLIKTCLMEWRAIERLVRHQVGQLEEPTGFVEKVVVVDTFDGPFPRQYDYPDPEAHRAAMNRLLEDGVVDRVVYAPSDPDIIRDAYRRWFGVETDETHSINGQQIFATLFGFEACAGDYALQLDSDLLISRRDRSHDYLNDMVNVLRSDPKALFAPMSIYKSEQTAYTYQGDNGAWRVEARGCLFDIERLQAVLPIPNDLENGRFALPWHRAFDRFIASGEYRSYRGGNPHTAFIHIPNERKTDVNDLLDIVEAVERGYVPPVQLDSVELAGTVEDWAGPKRSEPFVFIICGRNVEPGRFKRCFDSLVSQKSRDWGAIIVDDASTNGFGDYAEMLLSGHVDRVTLVRNSTRRGALYNTWNAVTRFCNDPETVIITLDADDALIGQRVLDRVRAEYDDGADLTVGSMLRLDKEATYPVDFRNPRSRSSNVWQHLRTFKKYLMDAIDIEDLKLDGEWIDLANDWAYMVPMVELASDPRHIPEPLYLYEPAAPREQGYRKRRDSVIARILRKPAYSNLVKR